MPLRFNSLVYSLFSIHQSIHSSGNLSRLQFDLPIHPSIIHASIRSSIYLDCLVIYIYIYISPSVIHPYLKCFCVTNVQGCYRKWQIIVIIYPSIYWMDHLTICLDYSQIHLSVHPSMDHLSIYSSIYSSVH